MIGNAQANILVGGAGDDTMIGGNGSDTYVVDSVGDVVVETNAVAATGGTDMVQSWLGSTTLGANVENGRILAAAAANLTGNSLNNSLVAGAGDNVLDGGAGTDTANYWAAASAVMVSLGVTGAQATGGSGSDTLISIENLTGTSFNDRLIGNATANRLAGNAGNDTLDGGAGNDTMIGGDGSDTYVVDSVGDVVSETNAIAATGGTDTVQSWLGNTTLGANVENGRILAAAAANLTGNSLNNSLVAGAGNNVLDGGAGTDTAAYWAAASAVMVSLGVTGAQATGGSGSDTLIGIENLTGTSFNDRLIGNATANRIAGGAGNDTLNGASGNDILVGGLGSDAFVFNTTLGAGNVDRITDFSVVDDTIRLDNAVMAALGAAGSLAAGLFAASASGLAALAGTRIVYDTDDGHLYYDADGNGAGAGVQIATLSPNLALTANDFLII